MSDGCVTCEQFSELASGNWHVGWGAIVVVVAGGLLVLGLVAGSYLLLLGIVLLVVGAGVFVDTAAHEWYH